MSLMVEGSNQIEYSRGSQGFTKRRFTATKICQSFIESYLVTKVTDMSLEAERIASIDMIETILFFFYSGSLPRILTFQHIDAHILST